MDWRNRRLGELYITQQAAGAFSFSNPHKGEILNGFWGTRQRDLQDFDVFFEFMYSKCEHLDPINYVIETYGDLLDLIGRLKTFRDMSLMDIRDEIRGEYGGAAANLDNQRISNSVELAVRIWMMLSLGTAGLAPIPGKRELPFPWNDGQNLNGILTSTFPTPQDNESIREFSDLFNLWDIRRLAGLEIRPTDNLLDHLLLQKYSDRKFTSTVFIFYHATLLRELIIGDPSSRLGDANGSFAVETLQTLGLLIPNYAACQKWFQGLIQDSTTIDPFAGTQHPTTRRVCDYKYWRTRLLILEKEFDKAEGASVISYLKDRRKPKEYATFWIAVIAFIFAVLAFLLTLWSAIEAELSRQQSVRANSMASVASTSADASASSSRSSVSAMHGSTSSPVTIVVCCNSSVTGNNSFSITTHGIIDPGRMTNSTTLPLVTSTIIATFTTTTSITQDVTTTIIVTIPSAT